MQNTAKVALRGKFIALNAYVRQKEKSQINHLVFHLKNLEKEEQNKARKRKEITKIRIEINKIYSRKIVENQ